MTDSSRGYQQFFAELKRRRVFRVMAVYGIVGFVLLQIVDLAVPALLLPEWTYRFIALILLLGFPVAIVLAWAFEMTAEGVQKTQAAAPGELGAIIAAPASQRLPAGLMALVGMTALLFGAWWVGTQTVANVGTTSEPQSTDVRLALADLADDPRPSIAVLPFADMSPEGDQEYFSDGMTEEILNVLAKIRALRVAARTSTFALKDRELTAVQWGDTLRVGYLVEGSVRKAGEEVRITAQLIDTSDGSHLWSESYDRALENVFQIQSEIAGAIAEALTVPLGLDDSSDLVTPTGDLEAYDLYLAGRAQLRRRGESLLEAIRLFEAAIARDSTWAPAWAALAEAKETRAFYPETYDLEDDIPDSLEAATSLAGSEFAATRALELDPRNSSAMVALGSVYRDRGQLADAEEFFHRALEVDPDNAAAHQEYAELLAHWGRIAEAVEFADRAAMLDPAPVRLYVAALTLDLDDRMSEATDVLRYAMRQDPEVDYIWSWLYGAVNLALLGEADEAIQAYERLWRNPPDDARGWLNARDFAAWASAAAEGRLDDLPEGWTFFLRDIVLTEQSDMDVTWLVNNNWKSSLGLVASTWVWSPALDSLRSDPRIQAHMRSVGLSDARLQRTPVEERTRPMILGVAR